MSLRSLADDGRNMEAMIYNRLKRIWFISAAIIFILAISKLFGIVVPHYDHIITSMTIGLMICCILMGLILLTRQ